MAQVLEGLRGLQPPSALAARLPHPPAGPRAGLPHRLRSRRVLRRPAARRRRPRRGPADAGTIRSHDQFNTTIYSNNDRYRGLKGLRTVIFMNENDMRDRGLGEFDLVDITSFSRDGSTRDRVRVSRGPLRHPPRLRGRLHARAQRAVWHRRLQHAERTASHQAPHRRDQAESRGRTGALRLSLGRGRHGSVRAGGSGASGSRTCGCLRRATSAVPSRAQSHRPQVPVKEREGDHENQKPVDRMERADVRMV